VARDHGHPTAGCTHSTDAHGACGGTGTRLRSRRIAASGFANASAIAIATVIVIVIVIVARDQSRGGFATMVHHHDRR
jgi:hypothetical protein